MSKFKGMGALPHGNGAAFRVWAPNAREVSVIGEFNDWKPGADRMMSEPNGCFYTNISEARIGMEYRYHLVTPAGEFSRIDPYAREVTSSAGNAVIHDPRFDWRGRHFKPIPKEKLIVYEMHIGTFNQASKRHGRANVESEEQADFDDARRRLDYLSKLGVNAVEIMPVTEFAGGRSWGYNPAHIFAVESQYGGPNAFKKFVKAAHEHEIAVILDVVYNHLGPAEVSIWQFDGWQENGRGGIYFYNDDRADTPWGNTRPDYGRPEVRNYIRDNVLMWLQEYRVDGLRFDSTLYIRKAKGAEGGDLPEGWALLQWLNSEIGNRGLRALTVAEDLQSDPALTKPAQEGGAGFGAQWDARFVHPIRHSVIDGDDAQRNVAEVGDALTFSYNGDPFQRVIYSESHDEVANGKARVPQEISSDDPDGWFAQKRSTLAAAMVFTAPGIPMLFQGQEFLQDKYFDDKIPLEWENTKDHGGILNLYRDLIELRLDKSGRTAGLSGRNLRVFHINEEMKVIAFHRWNKGGRRDDVIVVANFANEARESYVIGVPSEGAWKLRFTNDDRRYGIGSESGGQGEIASQPGDKHGFAYQAAIAIAPYTVQIYSQE
jgi:1,4-alpha-glucan branching enzyme